MAKLTITLRQDTPMWHFLPDETGCCLRATEVKPKLDKFLYKKLKQEGKENEIETWKIKDQKALDYKMTFVPNNDNECDKKDKYPTFFGNGKKAIYYKNGITMTIFSLNSDLVEKIKKHICEFFACHSFGTRQSKGFGCFYPEEIKSDDKTDEIPCCYDVIKNVAEYKFTTEGGTDFITLFNYINYFHKLIRSGINDPKTKTYYKSLMYFYAQKKDMTWDKPQIRHYFGLKSEKGKPLRTNYLKKCGKELAETGDRNCPRKSMKKEYNHFGEDEPYKFTYIDGNKIPLFRDALGLSSSQDWRYYKASLNINNKDVERFKSPFMYRPVKNSDGSYTIYILFYSIDSKTLQNLKEATFNITGKTYETDQNGKKVKNSDKKITGADLKAQIYKDFELSDYFEFIYDLFYCCREKDLEIKDIYKIFAENKKIDERKEKISECNNKPQQTSENNQQKDNNIDNIIAQIKGSFEKIEQKP